MSQLSKKLRSGENGSLFFWCPGCKSAHRIIHGVGSGPRWNWNMDAERPTFTPSVLVTGRDFTPKGMTDYEAWYAAGCPKNEDGSLHAFESADTSCHSFVTDGRIQFLGDCTHELSGETVDLPDWPDQTQ